jgi:endoglucanase
MEKAMSMKKFVLPVTLAATSFSLAATAYINQIGYRTNDVKELTLFEGNANLVEFVDASGQTVLSVTPGEAKTWNGSNQSVQLVDFSELKTPGKYSVKVNGQNLRSDITISDTPYEDVMKGTLKFYYYQRASMALEETYAGKWKRSAGHMDQNVKLHNSTGASGTISSPKGWYDAGDYGKYIVNSGISTYTLLSLFEHFPGYFEKAKWNIPAEGSLPDLLAEIKYNLDWMLTMQTDDGGVYHKLTTLQFSGTVMPSDDTDDRYAIGKGTAAAFDFAAVMATASRVFAKYDATYAAKCLEAAKKAYAWGTSNPNKTFKNPSDVATGEYGDGSLTDEKQFAATELFIATGDASYKMSGAFASIPGWADVSGLATYGKATHLNEFGDAGAVAKDSLLRLADEFAARTLVGFGVTMSKNDFYWGSNSVGANQGVWLLHAYYMTGNKKYYDAAVKALDYLLGKNPMDMSFVTGFGTKSPKHPHHRPSQADKVNDPVPGMLVGGPQPGGEDIGSETWQCKDYRVNGAPAKAYYDNECSYASNEVAINWNAPIAYLAGALEALNAGYAPEFAVEGVVAIPQVAGKKNVVSNPTRLRFADQKVFIEHAGKRYDLRGHRMPNVNK